MGREIIFLLCIAWARSQELQDYDISGLCTSQNTCGDCLAASTMCYWCSDCEYNTRQPGCNILKRLKSTGCAEESILNRLPSSVSSSADDQFSDISSTGNRPVQIKPQRVALQLSPLEQQTVSFKYRPAKDYPLDLYYLMDLTWSMRDDKETLVGLKNDLPLFLSRLTKNFRLGFGSFAEKPLMPYILTDEKHREDPCTWESGNCEPAYAYRHRLNMTGNIGEFVKAVSDSQVTGNLDDVECGLDALMQVLVCGERVGWSPSSRKIVLFATDGYLHFSGEGILGGVTKPNDKQCHLDENGDYTEAINMDYPSLEDIYRVLLEHRVSIIFAVTKRVMPHYDNIRRMFPNDVFVAELSDDSSNILNLVKLGYRRFTGVINFKDDAGEGFDVKYFSDCGVKNRPLVQTSQCDDVVVGQEYSFIANITLTKCPKTRKANNKITIMEERLGLDELVLDVKTNCNCECEAQDCSCPQNSRLECGKCVCLDGWLGRNCDCIEKEGTSKDLSKCKRPEDVLPCSGLGDCVCDACQCDAGYGGQYCECKACPVSSDNGQVCGGISRGSCSCGVCACHEDWFGPTCSCAKAHCVAPWETRECSGRGTCGCGQCQCRQVDERMYSGKYCETCADCDNPACSVYEECVRCVATNNCSESSCHSRDGTLYKPIELNDYMEEASDINHCIYREDLCQRKYTYTVENDWTVVLRIHPEECQNIFAAGVLGNTWGLVASILTLTLIVGAVGIVCYKVYDYLAYRREYRKFQAEHEQMQKSMATLNMNPIYKSPITKFEVPAEFVGSRDDIDDVAI